MIRRLSAIAFNTFREAIRDKVLYNLVLFALLMVCTAPLFGQISIAIERVFLINLGLAAIMLFGSMIAVFIGIQLVSKEMEKKTLYTVLSRPVRRWEFIVGKFLGLSGTLLVNTAMMAAGFYAALWYVTQHPARADWNILGAIYFIGLELVLLTAITLLFSSFSTPVFSALFAAAMFVTGSFANDLRGFSQMSSGSIARLARIASYVVPNFQSLNIVTAVSHDVPISISLLVYYSLYVLLYCGVVLCAAIFIFDARDLK